MFTVKVLLPLSNVMNSYELVAAVMIVELHLIPKMSFKVGH